MASKTDTKIRDRQRCARQFAEWVILSPELEEREDRRWICLDLERITERLQNDGRTIWPHLPSLMTSDSETVNTLARWTAVAMKALEVDPPEWNDDQNVTEKTQELIDTLREAALPTEPLDEWR